MQLQRKDLGMAEHVEKARFLAAEQGRGVRGDEALRARARRGGERPLCEAGDERVAGNLDGVVDPVGRDDLELVALLVLGDGDQHVAVGADLVGQVHEESGEIATGREPCCDGRLFVADCEGDHC